MPGGDRTGPQGMGPMTGRGAGYCGGAGAPGGAARGMRGGRGGRGHRHQFYATGLTGWQRAAGQQAAPAPPAEVASQPREEPAESLAALRAQAEEAAAVLERIRRRIDEISGQTEPPTAE